MKVATFHANRWTDPSQNLHGCSFPMGMDTQGSIGVLMLCPNLKNSHLGQKEASDQNGARIKVFQHL